VELSKHGRSRFDGLAGVLDRSRCSEMSVGIEGVRRLLGEGVRIGPALDLSASKKVFGGGKKKGPKVSNGVPQGDDVSES
jgi:hypothetical protein